MNYAMKLSALPVSMSTWTGCPFTYMTLMLLSSVAIADTPQASSEVRDFVVAKVGG